MLRLIVKLGLVFAFTVSLAECKKADPKDVPYGANELIEMRPQHLSHVRGTIFFPDKTPAADVVIEVYRPIGKLNPSSTVEQPRITACITGNDGKFSFSDLKSGEYVLHVGTRAPAGVDEVIVPIVMKKILRWRRKGSNLRLILPLGT